MMCRARPTRVALCIGVNRYPNLAGANLNGCVNDARDIASELRRRGYRTAVLTDKAANRRAILAHLRQMVRAPGWERAVFTMSSHGTQIADTSGDELDWLDEAVCPSDVRWSNDGWLNVIRDDEFAQVFATIPDGRVVDVVLDTCHSGTGIRALALLGGARPRFLAPPSISAYLRLERAQAVLRPVPRALGDNAVLWAACRADQYATDAYIGGRYRGAFTAAWLASARDGWSRARIANNARDLCASYNQTPQLEATTTLRDSPLWGAS